MAEDKMTLAQSREGQLLKVLRINGAGAIKQRLLDMGIGREAQLKVERYAPLKDPIQISVKGYSLALRVAEGQMIDVEIVKEAC
jgi:Fe2+ transport system protein FeoA